MKCLSCGGKVETEYGVHCLICRTEIFAGNGKRLLNKYAPRKITNSERWAMTGANSSVAAMYEVIGLREYKLIMSKL